MYRAQIRKRYTVSLYRSFTISSTGGAWGKTIMNRALVWPSEALIDQLCYVEHPPGQVLTTRPGDTCYINPIRCIVALTSTQASESPIHQIHQIHQLYRYSDTSRYIISDVSPPLWTARSARRLTVTTSHQIYDLHTSISHQPLLKQRR